MAGCSKDSDPPLDDAIPHEQEFETEIERNFMLTGKQIEKIREFGRSSLSKAKWGRILFEVDFHRVKMAEDSDKDLILTITCNKGAHDPHWRCSFMVTAQLKIDMFDETASQSFSASKSSNSFDLPITRMTPEMESVGHFILNIKININKWSGTYPAMIKSFATKTYLTDATLKVAGERLHISRAILAMHSTYFNTLFFDHRFPDAAKTEFNIPDVSLDEFNLFLSLIYTNSCDDQPIIFSMSTIEQMLFLAERFGVDCVKRLMEKYLMGEMGEEIDNFTLARRLLVADRYRLSAPTSLLMNELRDDGNLRRLASSDEYRELSDSLRASILDMRVQRDEEGGGSSSTSERPPTSGNRDDIPANFASAHLDILTARLRNGDIGTPSTGIRPLHWSTTAPPLPGAPFALLNPSPTVPSVQGPYRPDALLTDASRQARMRDFLAGLSRTPPQLITIHDSPSSSSSAPAPPSFTAFQGNVARVQSLLLSVQPPDLSRRLNESLSYLASLTHSQYDGTDSAVRRDLDLFMGTTMCVYTGPAVTIGETTRARLIERLITEVETLRDRLDIPQASSSKIRKIDHN